MKEQFQQQIEEVCWLNSPPSPASLSNSPSTAFTGDRKVYRDGDTGKRGGGQEGGTQEEEFGGIRSLV